MDTELLDKPYKVSSRQAVHFWVEFEGAKHLCRITYEALYDDYHQPGEADVMEIFKTFSDDILVRAAELLREATTPENGQPSIVVKSR